MNENLGSMLDYYDFSISSQGQLPIKALEILESLEEESIAVEIGVHAGWTLLQMFEKVKNKDIKVFGIDCWELIDQININGISKDTWTSESLDKFLSIHKSNRQKLQNILDIVDKKNMCSLIQGFSFDEDIVNSFSDESISFLHVDGDHSYEGCLKDLEMWFPKIKVNGYIVGDDYNWKDVKKAADQFISLQSNVEVFLQPNKYYIKKI